MQRAAAGHLLDGSSSARKTRFMQYLDLSAILLFNELPFYGFDEIQQLP